MNKLIIAVLVVMVSTKLSAREPSEQEGEYAWGDVTKDSVLGIYNNQHARRYREMHRSGARCRCEPCDRCNVYSPSFSQLRPAALARFFAEYWLYRLRYWPHGVKRPGLGAAGSPAGSHRIMP